MFTRFYCFFVGIFFVIIIKLVPCRFPAQMSMKKGTRTNA